MKPRVPGLRSAQTRGVLMSKWVRGLLQPRHCGLLEWRLGDFVHLYTLDRDRYKTMHREHNKTPNGALTVGRVSFWPILHVETSN